MIATYDVWDVDTGNNLGHFEREEEALRLVCALIDRYGESYVDDLQLGSCDADGDVLPPLSGRSLVERARRLTAAHR